MKLLYLFFILFCYSLLLNSQNTIQGQVLDASTNSPLQLVNVYFPELEKGSITDPDGKFTINFLPSGTYKMVYSIIGFETLATTIVLPNNSLQTIALNPSAIEMEEVIVSTPFHKLQGDNVMKVEQKRISDLKSSGVTTLSEGITEVSGVESITTGVSIGKPVIRGLSSNRVLIYTQGVRLENQQFGNEHGLGLSDSGVESIEVIKGPASLLYGSDALGGVLYLNPERFANPNSETASLSANYYSSTKGLSTQAAYKSSTESFKFLFGGHFAEHADYNTKEYRVTNSRFNEKDFKAGLAYQKNNFKTAFRYNINYSELGIPEEISEQSTNIKPLLPFQEINNHIFSSKSKWFLKNSSLDISLGYIYNDRKEFEEHEEETTEKDNDDEAALHMKLKTFNYDIKYNLPEYGKFETILGIQGLHQINTNYGEEELIPNATTTDFGLLMMSHIHFKKADVQIGLRYDYRNIDIAATEKRDYNSFNAAAGIKTNISNTITGRFNFATGFRAPNLAELASNGIHEGTNRYEIGNLDLDNEKSVQVDLSLEYKSEHVQVFANGFYNRINDYIFITPNGNIIDGNPVFIYIQDHSKLYGGEFGLHIHPHPLDWLHIESSFETVTGKQDNDTYLPLIPANTLKNKLHVEFNTKTINKGYAFIKLQSVFNQNKVSVFETRTPSYNLLSAGFGGTIKLFKNDLSLSVAATNLTNKTYVNHLSRLKPDNIFNMGRNFSVSMSYVLL